MTRRKPLGELGRLQGRVNALFERLLEPSAYEDAEGALPGSWSPDVDVLETDAEFVILAELPGLDRELLSVEVEGRRLTIQGRRQPPRDGVTYHRMERSHGPFRRVFELGVEVDSEAIEARYRDGVLRVRLPKPAAGAGAATIPIEGEGR